MMKLTAGERTFNIVNIVMLFLMMVITLYPLLFVLFVSLSDPTLIMAHSGMIIWPLGQVTLAAYRAVADNPNIWQGLVNSAFIVTVGTTVNILLTALGAYFLSRKNVLFRNFFMMAIVFTMFFNGGMIPMYFTVRDLYLTNTLGALIFPTAISTYNLIIMRTAFAAIPDSLEESAKLDGAGHWTILFQIMLPLAGPTVAVMVLYYGVHHWNAWFEAMIYLQKRELFPVQLILREILVQNETSSMTTGVDAGDMEMIGETIKYAVIMVVTVPILILYPFLQKYFVKGVMIGAVKG
jgi:putative aldouronate transport system permease protein